MIFHDFKKGLTRQECLVPLPEIFGNEAPSVVIPSNIDAVRKMIEEDRHETYHEIRHITEFNTFDFT